METSGGVAICCVEYCNLLEIFAKKSGCSYHAIYLRCGACSYRNLPFEADLVFENPQEMRRLARNDERKRDAVEGFELGELLDKVG